MAPIDKKRKSGPTNESFARSRKSADGDNRPSKRPRPGDEEGHTKTTKLPQVPKISKIRDEDVAFPRGGASILTPLEHKQIQIEATRDVLFEQGAKTSNTNEGGGDRGTVQRKKQKAQSKGKGKKGIETTEPEEDDIKIEGLSYKVSSRLHINFFDCLFVSAASSRFFSPWPGLRDQ